MLLRSNSPRRRALALPVLLLAASSLGAAVALDATDDPRPLNGATERAAQEELLLPPEPVDDGNPAHVGDLSGLDCATCHATIAEEWAGTRHATAWIDERYQEELAGKRRPQSCHGCHIPEPMHLGTLGRKPAPRADEDDPHAFGVTCNSCHQGPDGAMLGPWGAETDAHASAVGESFTSAAASNQLCISCHRTTIGPVIGIAKDFEVTGQEGKGLSCVGCHMRPVERPAAIVDGEAGAVREGRSHALQTPRDPRFAALAFGLSARVDGGEIVVVVANQAGHRVPGLTTRSFLFRVDVQAADGSSLGTGELDITNRAYLPADGTHEIRVQPDGGEPARIHVTAHHTTPGVAAPIAILDRLLAL